MLAKYHQILSSHWIPVTFYTDPVPPSTKVLFLAMSRTSCKLCLTLFMIHALGLVLKEFCQDKRKCPIRGNIYNLFSILQKKYQRRQSTTCSEHQATQQVSKNDKWLIFDRVNNKSDQNLALTLNLFMKNQKIYQTTELKDPPQKRWKKSKVNLSCPCFSSFVVFNFWIFWKVLRKLY